MVVDDHPIFLDGLAGVLMDAADIELVAMARNGSEALHLYRKLRPDVTLMDLQMPEMDGSEAISSILQEFPEARIVALSTFEGDGFVLRALRAGAFAYVLKNSLQSDLLHVLRSVNKGRRSAIAMDLCGLTEHDNLTPRELDVLRLVADGHSNKRIGVRLCIAEETVKSHMKSILPKLRANDRAHAVALAIGRGLLSAPSTVRRIE